MAHDCLQRPGGIVIGRTAGHVSISPTTWTRLEMCWDLQGLNYIKRGSIFGSRGTKYVEIWIFWGVFVGIGELN